MSLKMHIDGGGCPLNFLGSRDHPDRLAIGHTVGQKGNEIKDESI